jgi:hypothetical protein
VYKLDSNLGDCDFDTSLCDYVVNSMPVDCGASATHDLPNTNSLSVKHTPKYPFLNTDDTDIDRKSRDFYLSIGKGGLTSTAGVIYSPLIKVQPSVEQVTASTAWNSFNQKIFSVSFKYSSGSLADTLELVILQNRSDLQNVTKSNLVHIPIHALFTANTINQESGERAVNVSKVAAVGGLATCGRVSNQEQFVKWTAGTARGERSANSWFEVKRLAFFSCFDFRLGFHLNIAGGSGETEDESASSTVGLDDVQLNVEQMLLETCDKNVCKHNGRCFKFEGNPVCCCPPGFKVIMSLK